MNRFVFCLLVLALVAIILVGCCPPGTAYADTDYYVRARSNLYAEPFTVHLYQRNGALYIDAPTLAGVSGYTMADELHYTFHGNTISPPSSTGFGKTRCFQLEKTLDKFAVRVFARNGELCFVSGVDVLGPLYDVTSERWRYASLLSHDKYDHMIDIGAAMAYAVDILKSLNFKAYKDRYRNALYSLIQEDAQEVTFSGLQKQLESKFNKPLKTAFEFMEQFMEPDEIDAFYAGTRLADMKDYLKGFSFEEKVLGMKLSEYYQRIEQLTLAFDINISALRAVEYAAEVKPSDSITKTIVATAREISETVNLSADEYGQRLITELGKEHMRGLFYAKTADLIKKILYGEKPRLTFALTKFVIDQIPAIKFMSDYEKAYTLSELQDFYESMMIAAKTDQSYRALKYAAIMYFRCYYATCEALRKADMRDLFADWDATLDQLEEGCQEQIAALLTIPDAELELFQICNGQISPQAMTPVTKSQTDFSLLAPYRGSASDEPLVEPPSPAVWAEAVRLWETLCQDQGQVTISNYYGEIYVDEGDGPVLPVLTAANGGYWLNVLTQSGDGLWQYVYAIETAGGHKFISRQSAVLLDTRSRLYLASTGIRGMISATVRDNDYSAFTVGMSGVNEVIFRGDDQSASIADMSSSAYDAFTTAFGELPSDVIIDAQGGLFRLECSENYRNSPFGHLIP